MRRTVVLGFLAFVMLPACKDAHLRAIDLAHTGDKALSKHDWNGALASFEQALVLWPELQSAYEGRARSFEKMGDIDKAIASLATCPHPGCADERRRLEGEKAKATGKAPSADQPSVQLPAGVEIKTRCGLVTAVAQTPRGDDARRKLLAAAVRAEKEKLVRGLTDNDARTPAVQMAEQLGAGAFTAGTCDGVKSAAYKMLGNLTVLHGGADSVPQSEVDLSDRAFDVGLYSAALSALAGSPQAMGAVAKMQIRSPSELTAYLDALQSAGAARDCAVFTAILRVEQLPAKQRAALKKPLGAAIAALAPANGAKDSFKVSGRKAMPLDSLASGAQSCEELENLYNQSAAAAAKIQAMVAQMGGDEGTEVKIDRTAFIYAALRARFEQPMSKKDIADHDALLR